LRGFLKFLVVAGLALALLGAGAFVAVSSWLRGQLPDVSSLDAFAASTPKTLRIYARGGELLEERGAEKRTLVDPRKLPAHVVHAVLAAEDRGFYEHGGIDLAGIARALLKDVARRRLAHGGSTLTQQLAKTLFLSRERTLLRKWKELLLARKIEERYAKDDILGLYLNQIYLGAGAHGIDEAARRYFGRPANQLTVAQAATIAGLIKSPNRLSPVRDAAASEARRDEVLAQMQRAGWLTPEAFEAARAEPLTLEPDVLPHVGTAPWVGPEVWRFLEATFPGQDLARAGFSVYTTLDVDAQVAVNEALAEVIGRLDAFLKVPASEAEKPTLKVPHEVAARVKAVTADPPGLRVEIEGQAVSIDPGALTRYRAALEGPHAIKPGEWIRVTRLIEDRQDPEAVRYVPELGPQLALAVLDASSGAVRVLVGGDDPALHPYDRATAALRTVGSTIKPFVAALGLAAGTLSLSDTFENRQLFFRGARGKTWSPKNYEGGFDGRTYDVAEGLVHSVNTVAVQMLQKVGLDAVSKGLTRMGFTGPVPHDLSLALGSIAEKPATLAGLYAAFTNGGQAVTPYLVERVVRPDGSLAWSHSGGRREAFPASVAHALLAVLRRVVDEGTGTGARLDGKRVAGKTGTSNRARNVWFAGLCDGARGPLSAVVWIGYDDNRPMPGATGGKLAAPAWKALVGPLCR
jgi:penicillin-binding protein 1A